MNEYMNPDGNVVYLNSVSARECRAGYALYAKLNYRRGGFALCKCVGI